MPALLAILFSLLIALNSSSIQFGFRTTVRDQPINDVVTSTINMTLYWEQHRFQCNFSPTNLITLYLCNTSNTQYVGECDTNISANPVQYGLQIDSGNSSGVYIDAIIIRHSQPQVTYIFDYFCDNSSTTKTDIQCSNSAAPAFDIITLQNQHNDIFTFDPSKRTVSESNMISTDKPAECTPYYPYYSYDTLLYDDYDSDTNLYDDYDSDTNLYDDSDTNLYDDSDTNLYDDSDTNLYDDYDSDTNLYDEFDTNYAWYMPPIDQELIQTGLIIVENYQDDNGEMMSLYIANLDLSCGGEIRNVSIMDNDYYENKWIDYTYTDHFDDKLVYFFEDIDIEHPMTLPITIRITKTYDGMDETLVGQNVIGFFDAGAQFEFGSNFCMVIKDKNDIQHEDQHANNMDGGSVYEDKKHTDTVLIIMGIGILVVGIVVVYWVYNRHRHGLKQKLLFMEQQDIQHNAGIHLTEI